ncbi:biotin transporter BioY [Candidatus Galacturonibacter soehngenii]|uniref:Biotin transporter n=1 Tax=Candidatus Galacturonatibacter soehngenii TaxID=2307010 RepID=A0A7V7QNW5_9FIRM|nr:biotin transporter BioY [Candidatus Galacturonibacter soehngenii]KAB1440964.1 biotin transporter BioY [Candidatus Galacturonibacter soehngenii]
MNEKTNANSSVMFKGSIYQMALIGIMTAVTCILGPLSIPIPFSPVPISFTNLVIYITAFILGWKKGTLSYLIYLLLGLVGLPIFSNFSGGPGKLLGPTGGYLIGFILMAFISGLFIERFYGKINMYILGLVLASAANYLLGTTWLSYQLDITFYQALTIGVLPYLIADAIKIAIAIIIGPMIRHRLLQANLL